MISFIKISLFVVCFTSFSNVVLGERKSINQGGGGSGGGSNGRVKAVNSSSPTSRPPSNLIGGSTNLATGVGSNASNVAYNNGNSSISGSTITTIGSSSNSSGSTTNIISSISNNSGSTTNIISSISNNSGSSSSNNGIMSNFGNTGTLADRKADVLCPICDAVPDKSYDASVKVNVGTEMWTCGYLQETVQDVDPKSFFEDERNSCRQAQLKAEENKCCAQTMYINQPGIDFHDPCFLCGSGPVMADKSDELVDTGIVGRHTCGSLDMIMKQKIFSANLCPTIIQNAASFCCNGGMSARSSRSSLRGAAIGNPLP